MRSVYTETQDERNRGFRKDNVDKLSLHRKAFTFTLKVHGTFALKLHEEDMRRRF